MACSKNLYGRVNDAKKLLGASAREKDPHEDQGENGAQAIGHCRDDEEERED